MTTQYCAVRDAKGTSGQVKGMYLTVHILQQHGQSIGKVISSGFPKVIQLIMTQCFSLAVVKLAKCTIVK